ncbi:MAG: NmrA family NAD(P)-binding protein [Caulobacteraceae bacterium]|nr:NmrA family NAD(P)-binding protein [Caulobacteraceae bacterium]
MYAITGISGQVGGAVARALLADGQSVRAVVRDADKGRAWAERGCEVALATITDAEAMAAAFAGTEGVFLMTPPNFDPEPGFPEIHAMRDAALAAIEAARPGKVVFLSTVGAQASEFNLLTNASIMEAGLRAASAPMALLRPGWFMENAVWDLPAARAGAIVSFLQPADHAVPMIATADIGAVAAALLGETWTGVRVVELEAATRCSANDIAAGFARALGHPVGVELPPRDGWEALFRAQGANHPLPRMRMLDGFNQGWIDFEGGDAEKRVGTTPLDAVLAQLVARG